jgi:pectin methylesterase-like acyl-CoA thioesterase
MMVLAGAFLLCAAGNPTKTAWPTMPGWVVVEKSSSGDQTEVIQRAIDSLGKEGGVVFFPAGTYKHSGRSSSPRGSTSIRATIPSM